MKLKISLLSNKKIVLPKEFNHITQALIYSLLDRLPAAWLHDEGFRLDKRTFKLFTFSSLLQRGRFVKEEKKFIFPQEVSFIISSPVDWIIEQVAKNICVSEKVRLGENSLTVSSVEVIKDKQIESQRVRVNALTPIETHCTLMKGDGSKKTYYYSPKETEFPQLINKNLRKKWCALNKKEECPYNMEIEPVKVEYCRERIRNFLGTVIKGWTGHFWIEGDPELLRFGLAAGLGSRNSAGFGLVEVVRERKGERAIR